MPPRASQVNATLMLLFGGVTDEREKETGGASQELWMVRPNRLVPPHELPNAAPDPTAAAQRVGGAWMGLGILYGYGSIFVPSGWIRA